MSWYELLLSLHVLAAALWFGSGVAITVTAYRALATGREAFSAVLPPAGWWAGRAHPAAGVVILLTGFGMVADADLSLGDTWVLLGLIGVVLLFAYGGAAVGRTSDQLTKRIAEGGGVLTAELLPVANRLLLLVRIESALLALLIVNMIVKPGA
jgi:uncharacterized membrane protein